MGELAADVAVAVAAITVEGVGFPRSVRPPGTDKTLFLAGAGIREVEIPGGKILKVTAIGVYLEQSALQSLAGRWAGKTPAELVGDKEFYRDIYSGEFEKFTRVTMLLPLSGEQYAGKVSENCIAQWNAAGASGDGYAAVEKFREVFQPASFSPGASILFTHHTSQLTISFTESDVLPEAGNAVIESKALSEAILESIIGDHGVSPEAKQSLARRISELLNEQTAVTVQPAETKAAETVIEQPGIAAEAPKVETKAAETVIEHPGIAAEAPKVEPAETETVTAAA